MNILGIGALIERAMEITGLKATLAEPDNAAVTLLAEALGADWWMRGTRQGTRPDNVLANGRVIHAEPEVSRTVVRAIVKTKRGKLIVHTTGKHKGKVAPIVVRRGQDRRVAYQMARDHFRREAGRHAWP
jgi:hypothetical protein